MKLPIYLDYMATTPADPRVVEKMLTCLTKETHFGNPASIQHLYGREAAEEVEWARGQVANAINGVPEGVIFTSGATESINLAIKGAAQFYQRQGKHLITTQIEHKAVLDVYQDLSRKGFSVTYLPVQSNGLLDIRALKAAMCEETILVSIGHVNNEIGVIQDLESIGEYLRQQGALFHVDAAQSIGKTSVDVQKMKIDLLSLSAHKAYGPKGVGALHIRQNPRLHLEPLMHGGKQEKGIRSGTLPVHQIVGMGEAYRIAVIEMATNNAFIQKCRDYLWANLQEISGMRMNGDLVARVSNNLHLNFSQVEGESGKYLRNRMATEVFDHLAISKASACLMAHHEESHVLKAIGLSNEEIAHSFRVSLGKFTTEEEVEYVVDYLKRKGTGSVAKNNPI